MNIDDDLLEKARTMTGIDEKAALVRESLRALIERESARRLAKLGATALGDGLRLWTRDKRPRAVAERLGLAW